MKNEEKYFFGDFTHKHYRELLNKAKNKFDFILYSEIDLAKNFILWRHDVDFSLHEALRLAQIESESGVRSTFFLLPHSEFYNLLEKRLSDKVRSILNLGHEIALHFDPSYYNISSKEELERNLLLEKYFLEKLFGVSIKVFSFHNPTEEILKYTDHAYGGMINTYSDSLKKNVTYCSDSNGYWRHRRMLDVISDDSVACLQALTHPEWWTEKVMSPKEKIWRCIDGRANDNKEFYVSSLKEFGREVIDW